MIGVMVEGSKREARGYSWPPFEPGHTISLRHGARSDRFVEPLAAAFRDALLSDRPDLLIFPEVVAAWSVAEARCERIRVWHAQHGLLDAEGKVRAGHDCLAFESQAAKFREALGLTPLSDANLAKTRAEAVLTTVDLEGIRQRGREALARREALDAAKAEDVIQPSTTVYDAEVVPDE
jgi:hypothetical protein